MAVYLRRTILVALLMTVPPLLTWLLYFASTYVLYETSRTIDPHIPRNATVTELLAFLLVAALEVRARW